MQYSFNNSRKILKLTQFIPGIYNNFYYKILGYFWGVTMHAIKKKNKKIRFRPPIFQTIINNDFKKHKKHIFSAL